MIVPVVLAVTVVAGAAVATSVISTAGCGDNEPKLDASMHDATPDTPIA